MKILKCLILLSILYSGYAVDVDTDDNVYILTEANFDDFLEENPIVMVKFYAPWCGHCKKLAPDYATASRHIKFPLAKVDATIEKALGEKYNVQGYPTIKLFKNGEVLDYNGARDVASIVDWAEEVTDPNYKPPSNEVVALTSETFDEFVSDKPLMLVEFYAPWCGHCKQLAPELEKAASALKDENIVIAKVDATVEKKLADQFGVKGYPTMKVLRNGKRYDYNGPRDSIGIMEYMLKQAEPAAKKLNSVMEAKRIMKKTDVTIIGFFANEDGPQYNAFFEASEKVREELPGMGFTTDPDVIKAFKAQPGDVIIFYPDVFWTKYEEKQKKYNKDASTAEDLLAFLKDNIAPMVGQITQENAAFRYSKLPLCVVYYNVDFSPEYREGTNYWRNKVVEVAKNYKDSKYTFAVGDEEEFSDELANVGLGDSGLEHNVIVFGFDGKKYPMDPEKYDGELDENLEQFMKDINSGKVKAFIKSSPPPKHQKGPVKVLVGSTFSSIVDDETKDVLVEFYAPWCGHCKSFEPEYNKLAEKLKKEQPNIVIAKMDATANDPPSGYKVEGFPTIYFAPSGMKSKPIKYTGNRDLDDLEKFMKKHAVKSYTDKTEEVEKEDKTKTDKKEEL
ncbi:Protein disulfide-isomerase A4 [Strongyloides ratti]|uniref:Protein disulfide-isomerase n=1 Tax=Strongyloides ratti TaxID=34506 RepID=A0A090MY70_STRRB|nr:Protein disulfide-isomerase A4 [Strongyloides ratti]CEF66669.1 Protein disulfide-isomerase A4 [Strongyloides ratti]